jgi:hypothetical protein
MSPARRRTPCNQFAKEKWTALSRTPFTWRKGGTLGRIFPQNSAHVQRKQVFLAMQKSVLVSRSGEGEAQWGFSKEATPRVAFPSASLNRMSTSGG